MVNVSDDASVPTSFVFDSPVYLQDGTEYAIVLIANSIKYYVYTAKVGQHSSWIDLGGQFAAVLGQLVQVAKRNRPGLLTRLRTCRSSRCSWRNSIRQSQGEIYFTSSSVQPDTLPSLPFQTSDGSNIVRVLHPNHGMPKGAFVNSIVQISNVAPGTYNGLTDVQLTGNFSIDNVDLNSYTITVPGTAAVGSSRVGPDGTVATKNTSVRFDDQHREPIDSHGNECGVVHEGNHWKVGQQPMLSHFKSRTLRDTDWIPDPAKHDE